MEYCKLGDLQGYLSRVPPLSETQAQEITFQTLEGVRFMHENEFAHRDLKPGVRSLDSQLQGTARLMRTSSRTSLLNPSHQSHGGSRLQTLASRNE